MTTSLGRADTRLLDLDPVLVVAMMQEKAPKRFAELPEEVIPLATSRLPQRAPHSLLFSFEPAHPGASVLEPPVWQLIGLVAGAQPPPMRMNDRIGLHRHGQVPLDNRFAQRGVVSFGNELPG